VARGTTLSCRKKKKKKKKSSNPIQGGEDDLRFCKHRCPSIHVTLERRALWKRAEGKKGGKAFIIRPSSTKKGGEAAWASVQKKQWVLLCLAEKRGVALCAKRRRERREFRTSGIEGKEAFRFESTPTKRNAKKRLCPRECSWLGWTSPRKQISARGLKPFLTYKG